MKADAIELCMLQKLTAHRYQLAMDADSVLLEEILQFAKKHRILGQLLKAQNYLIFFMSLTQRDLKKWNMLVRVACDLGMLQNVIAARRFGLYHLAMTLSEVSVAQQLKDAALQFNCEQQLLNRECLVQIV